MAIKADQVKGGDLKIAPLNITVKLYASITNNADQSGGHVVKRDLSKGFTVRTDDRDSPASKVTLARLVEIFDEKGVDFMGELLNLIRFEKNNVAGAFDAKGGPDHEEF